MLDEIRIRELEIYAFHGVYPQEKEEGQRFYLNVTLFLDTTQAAKSDELEKSVNYGEICEKLKEYMLAEKYNLLETVAQRLSERLLTEYPFIRELDLEVRKPDAPIGIPFGSVSVKIRRGWHKAYLSIGSNLGDREKYLNDAVAALRAHKAVRKVRVSDYLVTKPYGYVEQGDFLNGAVFCETYLTPKELLRELHAIEASAGRTREIHWGPRTLDLDILFYDKLIYEDEELVIPHVDLENREFVLRPLCELAPSFRHPISQKTVRQMLAELCGE